MLEGGTLTVPDEGPPHGGVISPLLANVYLHYVPGLWFEQEVQPRFQGRAYLIGHADDFVLGFTKENDARRVLDVLPKRFGKYGLPVHPDKTRLVPFRSPAASVGRSSGTGSSPGTLDMLGFWRRWLSRRSRASPMSWDRFHLLLEHYPLPAALVVHSVCRPFATP